MAKGSNRSKRARITGVAAKIQRVKTSVPAIVDYILDLVQQQEKLYFHAWLKNIRLPKPPPGKTLTRQELTRALTDEIERNLVGVQANRRPAVEIIISLAPGEAWSPKRWEAFWERFLFHLSRVTYVTDHCVRRKGLHLERARPPKYIQADLTQYMAIVPCHDTTASQHIQPALVLWDPALRQVAVINDGFSQVAVQWAARRAEKDLELKPHRKMPDYLAMFEGKRSERSPLYTPKDNRLRVVDPKLIKKVGIDLFIFNKKREGKKDRIPRASMMGSIMRQASPAIEQLRVILKDRSPADFANLAGLDHFLRNHGACLRRPPKTAGLLFCVGSSPVKPKTVGSDWSTENLFKRWPGLKRRGRVVGMTPQDQKLLIASQNILRLQSAGLSGSKPSQQQLQAIIHTAHAGIDSLPWQTYLIEERRSDGTSRRCGEMTQTDLKAKISGMFNGQQPELDMTLHFRPVLPPGVMALPLWDLTKENATRLCQNYDVALLTETQPDRFSAIIIVAPFAGEEWENKRALRRLTHWLGRRYESKADVVAGDGIPLPGLPQLATTGQVVGIVGNVHDRSCPKASHQLARFGSGYATLDKYWAQGTPGWVLRQPEVRQLTLITNARTLNARTIYLNQVKALAKNPLRCGSLQEMNQRIAARMKGQRYENIEIIDVFNVVHGLWPKIVPSPLDCMDAPNSYTVNYSRDKTLFKPTPVRRNPLPPRSSGDQVTRDTGSTIGTTSTNLPKREDPTPPARAPIEPDVVYEKYTIPVLAQVFQWGYETVDAIIKQFMPEKVASPVPTILSAEEKERAKISFQEMLAVIDQLKRERRPPPTFIEEPALATPPPPPAQVVDQKKKTASSQSADPVVAKAPDVHLPGIQTTRDRVPVRSQPSPAVAKRDPEPEKKPEPLSPLPAPPIQDEAELKRRKKEKQLLRLEAIAGAFSFDGKVSEATRLVEQFDLHFKNVLVFEILWDSLREETDGQQLKQLHTWARDPALEEPAWLHDRLEFHEAKLNEMMIANKQRGQSAPKSTPNDLIR